MRDRPGCEARRYSDQYICHKCGFIWDVNDKAPPACKSTREREMAKIKKVLKWT